MSTHKPDAVTLGHAIKSYRKRHGLSQEGLGIKLGVSLMQIMRWENGKTYPNRLSLKALQEMKIIPPPRE